MPLIPHIFSRSAPRWFMQVGLLLLLCQVTAWAAQVDSVTPYGIGSGDAVSSQYSVTVNGVAVPVYNQADMSYVHFAFTGTAQVVVTVAQNVSSYQLSPHAFALAPSVSGNTVSFSLTRPRKLMLHAVNSLNEKLCIFADAPEEQPPVAGAANVTTPSGLDASGATDMTAQLQAAIDSTPTGNTLLIPAGRYTFTYLQLRSNRSYYLAPGAILQAPRTQEAQLKLNGCTNVKIFGRGVIDGQGDFQRARTGGGETGTTFISVDQGTGTANVVFEDVIIRNPSLYSCIVFDTVDWRFGNVKFVTSSTYSNHDCIDPHNAQRLVIDDCFFLATDDSIAFSTLRNDIDTGMVIKNCVMYNSHSGACIRLGPWLGDNTHHITAENCDYIKGANNEGAFAIYAGGAIRDVRFRNMRVENPQARLVYMISAWNDYYAGWQSGSIDNVRFENLSCENATDAWIGFDATDPASPMRNIAFTNFTFGGTTVTSQAQAHVFVNGTVSNLSFSTTEVNEVAIAAAGLSASVAQGTSFTVSRSGPTSTSLTIPLVIRGSAVAGSDYAALASSVVIPAGASAAQITITPLKSSYPGGRATVVIALDHSPAYSYLLGPHHRAMTTLINGVSATAPVITSHPENLTVTAGQTATFTVAASGTGPLSYQWQFAAADIGGNSATLNLANVQAANAGSYRCVVTNSAGSATSTAATLTVAAVPVGGGTGLTGTYFPNSDLTGLSVSRVDATVNFDWGQDAPVSGIPADNFSVRWAGQVQAQFSETYTFSTVSDDGVRLWINGQQLIDNWTEHAPTEDRGTITLIAGQTYDLKLEFYERAWGAVAQLSWASPSTAMQIIPRSQLFPIVEVFTTIANGSFESPAVDTYVYNPSGASWTFSDGSAIQANGSAWGAATAPDGRQTAVLQGASNSVGSISQTVSLAAGSYRLAFKSARRAGQVQPVRFLVDAHQVGTDIVPSGDAFADTTTATFTVTAGNHVLRFEATDRSGDKSSFIDLVSLVPVDGSNPPGALPAGWTAHDIGDVSVAGAATHDNGTWTVTGSGSDIWGSADGCRFVSRRVTGDVQVTAYVSGLTNTNDWAKAGVMIRESLATGSRHASTFATAANGLAYQRRLVTDGVSSHTAGPGSAAPYWVRIARLGNVIVSSTSPNGTTWTEIRRETIAMSATVYVGLAVTSHSNGALCTATCTNVQVIGVAAAAN